MESNLLEGEEIREGACVLCCGGKKMHHYLCVAYT